MKSFSARLYQDGHMLAAFANVLDNHQKFESIASISRLRRLRHSNESEIPTLSFWELEPYHPSVDEWCYPTRMSDHHKTSPL